MAYTYDVKEALKLNSELAKKRKAGLLMDYGVPGGTDGLSADQLAQYQNAYFDRGFRGGVSSNKDKIGTDYQINVRNKAGDTGDAWNGSTDAYKAYNSEDGGFAGDFAVNQGGIKDGLVEAAKYAAIVYGASQVPGLWGGEAGSFGGISSGLEAPAYQNFVAPEALTGVEGSLPTLSGVEAVGAIPTYSTLAAPAYQSTAGLEAMSGVGGSSLPTLEGVSKVGPLATAGTQTVAQKVGEKLGLDSTGIAQKGLDFLGNNAGAIAGGLLGAAASGDTTTSASKDPWGPAQSYLKDNLAQNAAMQKYYMANPFSNEQKQAYQGVFDANANAQANVQGLLGNASNFMQSNRGAMPQMNGLLSGVKAQPIDWSKYANIGGKG